jgi:hypothetical protein
VQQIADRCLEDVKRALNTMEGSGVGKEAVGCSCLKVSPHLPSFKWKLAGGHAECERSWGSRRNRRDSKS